MLDDERQRLAEVAWRIAHFMLGSIDMDPAERERQVIALLDGLDEKQQQIAVMGAKIVLDSIAADADIATALIHTALMDSNPPSAAVN